MNIERLNLPPPDPAPTDTALWARMPDFCMGLVNGNAFQIKQPRNIVTANKFVLRKKNSALGKDYVYLKSKMMSKVNRLLLILFWMS